MPQPHGIVPSDGVGSPVWDEALPSVVRLYGSKEMSKMLPAYPTDALPRAFEPRNNGASAVTLLEVLWHRRYSILIATTACLTAGFVYLMMAQHVYASSGELVIQQNAPRLYSESDNSRPESESFLASQVEAMQSSVVLGAAFDAAEGHAMKMFAGIHGDPITWLQQGNALKIDVVKHSDIVSVGVESPYPEEATRFADAVMSAYLKLGAETNRATGGAMAQILQTQKQELEKRRETCLAEMLRLKADNGVVSFTDDRGNLALERTTLLSTQLNTDDMEVWDLQSQQAALREALASDVTVAELVEGQQIKGKEIRDAEYDQLRQSLMAASVTLATDSALLGPSHYRVKVLQAGVRELKQRVIEKERQIAEACVADLGVQIAAAQQKQVLLKKAFDEQRSRAQELNPVAVRYATLAAEADQLQKQCEQLEGRSAEVQVNHSGTLLNARILEPARVAEGPVRPRKSLVLALAGLVGLLSGGALALAGEYRGLRFRSARDLSGILGIPVVGAIPRINPKLSAVARGQIVHLDARSPVAEAYRAARTSLNLGVARLARTLLLVSPSSGEGKSATASNLAIAFAQAGHRTLLVDCDLRRPVQHLILQSGSEIGLSSVVAGEARLREAVRHTNIPHLYLLPAGPVPSNPAELLSSKRFALIMKQLAKSFDRILIDSPALSDVTDGIIMAASADATLLVARMNRTTRNQTDEALNSLEKVGARLAGVIANDLPPARGPRYYGGPWEYATDVKHLEIRSVGRNGYALPHADDSHRLIGGFDARPDGLAGAVGARAEQAGLEIEDPDWSSNVE